MTSLLESHYINEKREYTILDIMRATVRYFSIAFISTSGICAAITIFCASLPLPEIPIHISS